MEIRLEDRMIGRYNVDHVWREESYDSYTVPRSRLCKTLSHLSVPRRYVPTNVYELNSLI